MQAHSATEMDTHARRGRWVLGCWMTLIGMSSLGAAFAPYLATHHPTGLLVMSPLYRHLVLIAPQLDLSFFVGVGVVRRLLSALVFYGIGYFYGPAAIAWAERRSKLASRWLRLVEGLFRRVGPVLVLWPSLTLWMLAGASKMSLRAFAALSALGIGLTMAAVWQLGSELSAPITWLLGLLRTYLWQATLLSIVTLASAHLARFYGLRKRRAETRQHPSDAP